MNKKKKSNKSGYPDETIKTLARCFYPSMVEFFNSEEGKREYEEWLKEQEVLQALPVIFCEDFDKFSSSSMNRLIFRNAS